MNVLHVIPKMDPAMGGVGQAVRSIITGLEQHRIYNEVVSLDAPGSSFLNDDVFLIHALGHKQGPWIYSKELLPWLTKNLSRFNVVIVHGLWQYHAYAVKKAMHLYKKLNQKSNLPSLYIMPHGMLDPYFQRATGRKIKALRNLAYWKLIERHIIHMAEGILFTCEEEQRLASEPFKPYHPKKEIVTGLGVTQPPAYDTEIQNAFFEKCPPCEYQPYLLFLGRIDEKKGVDLLVNAYKNIWNKSDAKKSWRKTMLPALVIAGPGMETAYGKSIKRLVDESSLQNKIFFPGMLTGDAKWGAFYGCDAFILPSHQENFGIAVVEALACSKPVMISTQVNIWREIKNAKAGLADSDTTEGTQYLLESWLQLSSEDKMIMQRNARVIYEEQFSVHRTADRISAAIKASPLSPVT